MRPVEAAVERALGDAEADLGAPVGLAHAGERSGVDVEDVAGLVREALEVRVVAALVPGDLLRGDGRVLDERGDDQRCDAERRVLGEDREGAHRGGHGGIGDAVELDDVHDGREVLALDVQRRGRSIGLELVIGHDAVGEDVGRTADGHGQHDAEERDRDAAREEEEG